MTGILLPTSSLSSDAVHTPSAIREIKNSLIQKPAQEYECGLVAVDTTVGLASAIILYRMPREMTIFGITMPEDSFTLGYFWEDRPYNIYHWLDPKWNTLAHYVNVSDQTSISATVISWRDLVIDVLIIPDGEVSMLDEDELPNNIPAPVARRIECASSDVVRNATKLVTDIDQASRAWLNVLPSP